MSRAEFFPMSRSVAPSYCISDPEAGLSRCRNFLSAMSSFVEVTERLCVRIESVGFELINFLELETG